MKKEISIWAKCILSTHGGLPIPKLYCHPPLTTISFISDAAGAAVIRRRGFVKNVSIPGDRGVASLGFNQSHYFFLAIFKWEDRFLNKFLSHSTVFEGVGLLLPFISQPQLLKNKFVILYVDNEPFVLAWQRRYAKKSIYTSILLQTLHILEATLPCRIFIEYQKRCSNDQAILVDKLSRLSTTDAGSLKAISHLHPFQPRGPLLDWLKNPQEDDDLPFHIAHYVDQLLKINHD